MRRIVPAVFLIAFIMGLCAHGQDTTTLKVKMETASLRISPEINAEIVARLESGTLLRYLDTSGNWYRVETLGNGAKKTGYIHGSMVETLTPDGSEENQKPPQTPSHQNAVRRKIGDAYASGIILSGGLSYAGFAYGDPGMTFYDDTEFQNRKRGFLGGLSFDMGRKLGIEFGFFYMQKGAEWTGSVTMKRMQFSGVAKIMVDELSVPVLMKIKLGPYSAPYIALGAELAYVLSSKYSWVLENTQIQLDETGSEDIVEQLNRIDYGLVVGAGFELKLKSGSLVVSGRYHLGLADINRKEDTMGMEDSWVRSNAFVALLGVKF